MRLPFKKKPEVFAAEIAFGGTRIEDMDEQGGPILASVRYADPPQVQGTSALAHLAAHQLPGELFNLQVQPDVTPLIVTVLDGATRELLDADEGYARTFTFQTSGTRRQMEETGYGDDAWGLGPSLAADLQLVDEISGPHVRVKTFLMVRNDGLVWSRVEVNTSMAPCVYHGLAIMALMEKIARSEDWRQTTYPMLVGLSAALDGYRLVGAPQWIEADEMLSLHAYVNDAIARPEEFFEEVNRRRQQTLDERAAELAARQCPECGRNLQSENGLRQHRASKHGVGAA